MMFTFKRLRSRRTRRVYRIGGGWGNRIEFELDDPFPVQPGATARVWGWKAITPTSGDYLTGRLSTGSEAIARFTTVTRRTNPPDLFWAKVAFVCAVPSGQLMSRLQQLEPTATIVIVDRLVIDRELLERLGNALEATGLLYTEIVARDVDTGWPTLKLELYLRGRGGRYSADSVWVYRQGDPLPGAGNAGRRTAELVFVWGHSFEYTFPAAELADVVASRIIATLDDRRLLTIDDKEV